LTLRIGPVKVSTDHIRPIRTSQGFEELWMTILGFILVNAYGTIWSIKFLSNSQHVIGSYFDKLLGVKTLCIRAKNHFEKLDGTYAAFLNEYQISCKPAGDNVLSWKNPWAFFYRRCCWSMQKDTGDNVIEYTCILLPTSIIHDFWLSPAVHILCKMKSKGVAEEKLLELMLLGAYQTSWFRFRYVGLNMLEKKRFRLEPFQSYVQLAEETFGTVTGDHYLRPIQLGLMSRLSTIQINSK
jgi:hypothetical protein